MSTVNLIWTTPDGEKLIAYMARVSNKDASIEQDSKKLMAYLLKHNHVSPFEMASACVEINCTRDIARQILRHRSFSFQEFSQRYAVANDYELSEARLQDLKNRQNSIPVYDRELEHLWFGLQSDVMDAAKKSYDKALEAGIAKEVARKVLPEGLIMSKMYMSGTIRSWKHYIDVRTGPETQKEHREVAQQIKNILAPHYPSLFSV